MLRTAGTTAVIVSHDQEEVLSLADRVAVMNEGRVIQVGTPEDLYRHPADSFVASFVGRTNLFELVVQGSEANLPFGRVSLDRAAEGVVVLAIRPEHLEISAPLPSRPLGLVKARLFKGHDITFTVQIEGRDILVHTDNRCPFKPGDQVSVAALESAVIVSA